MPKSDPREALSTDAWQMIVIVAGNWKRDQNDTALIKAIASRGRHLGHYSRRGHRAADTQMTKDPNHNAQPRSMSYSPSLGQYLA
jgi:hypothetical protein